VSESLITVIVPTYNRASVLRFCLEALEMQTMPDFNVIVVNDGSTDSTAEELHAFTKTSPLRLRILSQENAGPARGRNLAITHTVTPFALLIGDDILATPTLVEAHVRFHREHPQQDRLALGWTTWDDRHQQITPFMRWYEKIQFDYVNLLQGVPTTWQHAYTSNLSAKTSLFRENPFEERFRYAAWEDSELAFRLAQKNSFHLTFLRTAVATHVHPTTFLQAARRMATLGRMERLFHELQPAARSTGPPDRIARICSALGRHAGALAVATAVVDQLRTPGRLHSMVLRAQQQRTYLGLE
jgi:glycosyltransferase involved in cell wall biosynthesis